MSSSSSNDDINISINNQKAIDDARIRFHASNINDDNSSKIFSKNENENENSGISSHSQRIHKMKSQVHLPRLIARDYPYEQSSNRVRIQNENVKPVISLYIRDWFHFLLRVPWFISIPIVILIWYVMIVVFAYIYFYVDRSNANLNKDCGLGEPDMPISFAAAYAFSLETCTTVGCE